MKRFYSYQLFLILVLMFTLTSCATNRGVVRLDVSAPAMKTEPNGKTVIINSVIDNRQFQENPKTQDIPSLGFGGATGASADIKKRAIGRKRNGFGKALGDILLEEGQTVETVISSALKRSFSEKGYKVLEDQDKIDNTIMVEVSIEKFWAYMTPGFWAITLSSVISTDITLNIPDNANTEEKVITVKSDGHFQTGIEENWMEIINAAVQKYIDALKKEL